MVSTQPHIELNSTMAKFGAPDNVLRDYRHWSVLFRDAQVTLGALVLIAKGPATAFPELPREAFAELAEVSADIEAALSQAFAYDKINYLMLMMVDPHVHFHVIPRYATPRTFDGHEFADAGWPGPPRLDAVNASDAARNARIHSAIMQHWA
ncbi:HIT family protein [Halomonas sp. IOP_31]|uniref:HIT family protein n=1 Tax=Halomonas sp. IOP_31 TaxID=2876584 RepID=UPI001E56682C|nr:HIT family protein [Halomonas sp. IOP_31]MCD6008195.1 HIT family protein [Halomonas sp. IOP_31]